MVYLEITDQLDLHHFSPKEIKTLVQDYLEAAATRGFAMVRIIHGKGIGNLRRTVHALLDKSPLVDSYRLADETGGSWGATIVRLVEGAGQISPENYHRNK